MTEPMFWPWSAIYAIAILLIVGAMWIVERVRPGSTRRLAVTVALGSALIYLSWRVAFTIPTDNPAALVAGILLVTAEIVATIQLVATTVLGWQRTEPTPAPLSALAGIPSVDIYIATYSEPIEVLEPTLAGAMGIRYPGLVTVYLCDDGSRTTVRELAERYGASYIQREEHEHAKAGNLNN